jgi:cytochrome b561
MQINVPVERCWLDADQQDALMQLRNSSQTYGAVPKTLHWLTVALVIVAWLLGTFGDDLPRGAARSAGLFIHISAGVGILILLVLRVIWRVVDRPPPPEVTPLGSWLEVLGKLTHVALYVLLAAAPILGTLLQFARGETLPLFGTIEIASPWVRDRAFASSLKDVHETLADILMILAVFHALAAMVHHWLWRDRTLSRMLPRIAR